MSTDTENSNLTDYCIVKKIFCLIFLTIGFEVYAESFMFLGNVIDYELLGNAVGQGRTYAIVLQNVLENKRIRYEDVSVRQQQGNEMFIRAIVQRHTIRRGDIYYIGTYFSRLGSTKVGIVEFTSDTQYTYWFYYFQGTF